MIAIEDLSDAIDVTRDFLTPISAGKWLRLAIIVLFVSSFGFGGPVFSGGNAGTGTVTDAPPGQDDAPPIEETVPPSELLIWGLVALAIVLAVWLTFGFLSGVMAFVFLESLRTSEVHVRRYFRAHLGRGLRLFLFRIGLGVLTAILLGVPILVIVFIAMGGPGALTFGSILVFLPYAIVVGFLYAILTHFTTAFVAPVMLIEGRGVVSAWRRFLPTMRTNWTEYGVYLLLVWILQLVAGAAAWVAIGVAGIVVAIPFVLVVAILVLALGPIGVALSLPVGILGAALGLLLVGLVLTPVATYFQYYALLVLGDTDAALDLIPDRRAAARAATAEWRDRSDDRAAIDRDSADENDETDVTDEIDESDDASDWDGERDEDEPDDGADEGWR